MSVSRPPEVPYGLAPGDAECPGRPGVGAVDGVSVQSAITQSRFRLTQPRSICGGRNHWIISADLGVHPTRAGHEQIASSATALVERRNLL